MVPTFATAVGRFGAAVAARLAADAGAGFALCHVPEHGDADRPAMLAWYRDRLAGELHGLLRAAATGPGDVGGRLDLVLVADVEEAGGALLAELCHAASTVLREHFAIMFPPDAPAEQRSVGLVVVLAAPALDGGPRGRAALAAVAGLERWHAGGPPSPVLNRVYLMPRQTEVMPLADDDVERAVYLFVATAYRAGLRDSEPIRRRLAPPRAGRGLIDSFIVAAADIDVGRVVEGFAWRSALAGLGTLAAQCQRPVAHLPELDHASWLHPLGDGRPGRDLALAAARGGAGAAALEQAAAAVDAAEVDALAAAGRAVRELADARLGGDDGLGGFSAVAHALDQSAERLRAAAAAVPGLPTILPPPAPWGPVPSLLGPDDSRGRVGVGAKSSASSDAAPSLTQPPAPAGAEQAWNRPRRAGGGNEKGAGGGNVVAPASPLAALLLAAATGTAAAALAAVAAVRAGATAAGGGPRVISAGAPAGGSLTATLVWGLLVGVLFGGGWALVSRWLARRQRAASDEAATAERAAPRPADALAARAAEHALALRRRRVARGALAILADERLRLEALRAAVLAAQVRAAEQCQALGVAAAAAPADDDYRRLLDPETPLHWGLLPAAALPRLWERSRAVRDEALWAARLLQHATSAPDRHRDDLPFAPGGPWEAALREQHGMLAADGVFTWPDLGAALHERVQRFLAAVPQALRLGVRARRPDGTPEPLSDAREVVVIAPPAGRAAVERALATRPLPDHVLLAGGQGARVVVLRTAGELDTASLS